MNQGHPLDEYYLVADSQLPNEDLMIGGGLFADSLQDCAILCERQNSILSGSYHDDGAISTGYSFNHANAFVFDVDRKLCYLKNKRMGNFDPMQEPLTPSCAFYNPREKKGPRYISGYRWNSLINEINSPYPNIASGMQRTIDNPGWSTNDWGKTGNFCK